MRLRSPRALLPPIALILTSTAAGAAQAQEAGAQDASATAELQEIVVTAQKREERLHDVPMGVTAITSEELNSEQLVDFADLEAKVPGLSVELIAPGQDRLTIRGENVGGVGSTVTTYIDDVPFGSSNALANGSIQAGDFDTWDLQRVEVLRGPQGTLYGAGAEGGLLKYVTVPPDPTKFSTAAEVGDEDIDHGGNGAYEKAMVNVPIAGIAALRLDGFDTHVPGYVDNPQLNQSDVNHGYQAGGRASFLLQPTASFSIRLSAFGQTLHTDGLPYTDVVGAEGNPVAPPANQLQPLYGYDIQRRFIDEPSSYLYRIYSAEINWNLGWGTLTSITSYGTMAQDTDTDITSAIVSPPVTYGDIAESVTGAPTGVEEIGAIDVYKKTEELRLASNGTQPLEWQVGAFWTHEASYLYQALPTFSIPGPAYLALPALETAGLDGLYREWSIFGQVTYQFTPQFDVALGGRWSENKQAAEETIGGLLVSPTEIVTGSSTGTDFTYSVAPRWHITSDTMVYARMATGYRPGGPNPLPPGAPAGVETQYRSDTTLNYELGTRTSLLDNRLSIDVAAFLINWHSIQLLEVVDGFGIDANGGKATSKGAEWTFGFTPLTGLTLTLTGAYVDAYLTSPAPDAGGNTGDVLPYVPKFSTSLDGNYRWHAVGGFDAFAGATWSYIGSRFNDFSATSEVVDGAVVSVADPRAQLGGYGTVALRLGLESDHWMFELYAKNLGDVRGRSYYLSSGAPAPEANPAALGGDLGIIQPRTLGALVELHF